MKSLLPLIALLNSHGLLPDDAMIMTAGWRGASVQFALDRPNPSCLPHYWLTKEFLGDRPAATDSLDKSDPVGEQFEIETLRDGRPEFSITCKRTEDGFYFAAWSRVEE
jgi:hypothetical protein